MEEKKNRFFDFDTQVEEKKEEPKKEDNAFSKVFGNIEIKEEVDPDVKTSTTFENVFKTSLPVGEKVEPIIEKKIEVVEATPKNDFSQVFKNEIKKEDVPLVQKISNEIPNNASKFFNVEPKVEEPVTIIQTEEPSLDYEEKIGDNPMIDYDRINREAKENERLEEMDEEPKVEEVLQSNRSVAARINTGGSDLMKLRMSRR